MIDASRQCRLEPDEMASSLTGINIVCERKDMLFIGVVVLQGDVHGWHDKSFFMKGEYNE